MDLIGSYDDSDSENYSENSAKNISPSKSTSYPEITASSPSHSSITCGNNETAENKNICSHQNNILQCQLCRSHTHESSQLDFFGLMTASESSDEEGIVSKTSIKTTLDDKVTEHVPKSSFWCGNDGEINWHDQSLHWKCDASRFSQSDGITEADTSAAKHHKGYTSKRTRIETLPDNINENQKQNTNRRLEKSCFIIHHKIAPCLHSNTIVSKPPRQITSNFEGHLGAVNRVQWCKSSYSHLLLSASMDKTVKVWNAFASAKSCVQILYHHSKAVKDAKWSPSGLQILSCGYDKTTCQVDVEKGSCISRFVSDNFVTCVSYHPVNHNLFISGSLNCINAWDCRTAAKPTRTFHYKDVFGQVQDVAFLPSGNEFFSCNDLVTRDSSDRNIMAWDFNSGIVLSNQIYQERFTCCHLKVLEGEATLLAQSHGDYIAQFSTIKPYKMNKCRRFEGHKVESYSIGFDISPDKLHLVSGSADGHLPVYDIRTTRVRQRLQLGPNQVCLDVAWHPLLSSTIAVGTWDGGVLVWS